MRLSLAVMLVLSSCATLNTAGMSEPCRNLYNACLNTCPSASPQAPPGGTITTQSLQTDVAACTQGCNEKARACQ